MEDKNKNIILSLVIIAIGVLAYMALKPKNANAPITTSSDQTSVTLPGDKNNQKDNIKTAKYHFSNFPYEVGKAYVYNDRTKWTFVGYEDIKDSNNVTIKRPAFTSMDSKSNSIGESFDIHQLILIPTEGTSDSKVQILTSVINGKIIQSPGNVYNQIKSDSYLIQLPEYQNIFDAISFYKKYENFKFVEPNWLIIGSGN